MRRLSLRTLPRATATFVRPLHISAARQGGPESDLHEPDRAAKVEQHKQEALRKQQEGRGHWKGELASDSEHAVKADRDGTPQTKEGVEKMQRETVEKVRESHGQK